MSGCSLWVSTTMEPPLPWANCAPTHRSWGQVVVKPVEIASRLNQYGNPMSWGGIVPVAWMISGRPTTASASDARLSVKPPASAGAAGAPRAIAAVAANAAPMRTGCLTWIFLCRGHSVKRRESDRLPTRRPRSRKALVKRLRRCLRRALADHGLRDSRGAQATLDRVLEAE